MTDSQDFNQKIAQMSNEQFTTHLAKTKTYLFYGQTTFLSEESAQLLVDKIKACGITNREIFYINNKTKFASILDSLQSPELFDPKKIVELRLDTDKPTKKIGEQLLKVALHQSNNIVIIQAFDINYRTQKEKWFTSLIQNSVAVTSKAVYSNQLPNWIFQRTQYVGIEISSDALKKIIQYSEGNLLWTNQILMQLKNSDYPRPIAVEVIEEILADMSVFQIEDLTQAIFNKKKTILKIIKKLEQENESLVFITTVLYREFSTLKKIISSGLPFNQACSNLRIWQNKQRNYQIAINNYNITTINRVLQHLATLDKINKGQHKGDGWLLLTRIATMLLTS